MGEGKTKTKEEIKKKDMKKENINKEQKASTALTASTRTIAACFGAVFHHKRG